MNETTELLDYELRRTHHQAHAPLSPASQARADLLAGRRRERRHRLAARFRSVADRLDS